jgi:hypothetical protein
MVLRPILWGGLPALLLLLVGFGGCSSGPNAEEILERSRAAMFQVQSYRWTGEHRQESIEGGFRVRETGEWAGPDRWYHRLDFLERSGDYTDAELDIQEVMVVGGRVFHRNHRTEGAEWQEEFSSFPPGFQTHRNQVQSFLRPEHLTGVWLAGETVLKGSPVLLVRGETREIRDLPPRGPEPPEGVGSVEFVSRLNWYISLENHRLLRYEAERQTIQAGQVTLTNWTDLDFYDYNRPVVIEVPEIVGD